MSPKKASESGLTLIELIAVIAIIGLVSTLAMSQLGSVLGVKQNEAIRSFSNTWELLYRISQSKGVPYRLILDLDNQAYYVRREVLIQRGETVEVDYLKNLRTKSEQKRRQQEQLEEEESEAKDVFAQEDERQTRPLQELFFDARYFDTEAAVKLVAPLDLSELRKQFPLPADLSFKDVQVGKKLVTEGLQSIRFSPRGISTAAIVHFELGDAEAYKSVYLDSAAGEVVTQGGYLKSAREFKRKP